MSGVFMQTLGRKTTVQLTSIPFLIGWTIIGLSTDITFLCLGRFISGVAIGKRNKFVYIILYNSICHSRLNIRRK